MQRGTACIPERMSVDEQREMIRINIDEEGIDKDNGCDLVTKEEN